MTSKELRAELTREILLLTEDEAVAVLEAFKKEFAHGVDGTAGDRAERALNSSNSASIITEIGGFVK